MQLSIPVIVEILKFLSTGHFFNKHVYLCKRVAKDFHLSKYMCRRHLGIVEDQEHELDYLPQASHDQYSSLKHLGLYLNAFTRKSAHKLFLIGFQAYGGVESNESDPEMLQRGITHLFIDS